MMKKLAAFTFLFFLAFTAHAADIHVNLIEEPHGSMGIEGSFVVDASTAAAWSVLTDYDHLSNVVSSMVESRITRREKDHLMVEQKFNGQFMMFSRSASVLLLIQEQPMETIDFEDVQHRDFTEYVGEWTLSPLGDKTTVSYSLRMVSRFHVPSFVKRRVMKNSVAQLLNEVRDEILKKSAVR